VRTVFVDSGAWIALLKPNDRNHVAAASYYRNAERRLVTTNYVVDETASRLRYDLGLRAALSFRDLVEAASSGRRLQIAWVDMRLEREGWAIMEHYSDVDLSLTDAISAAAARRRRITEIFGFDADFRALGFDVQPAP
jgi:uncharacterized protein